MVDTENERLTCKHMVINASLVPREFRGSKQQKKQYVARAVFLTDSSILQEDPPREDVTLLSIPRAGAQPVRVVEVGAATYACPKGMYLVHMTTTCASESSSCDVEAEFEEVARELFGDYMSSTEGSFGSIYFLRPHCVTFCINLFSF